MAFVIQCNYTSGKVSNFMYDIVFTRYKHRIKFLLEVHPVEILIFSWISISYVILVYCLLNLIDCVCNKRNCFLALAVF